MSLDSVGRLRRDTRQAVRWTLATGAVVTALGGMMQLAYAFGAWDSGLPRWTHMVVGLATALASAAFASTWRLENTKRAQ